MGRAGAARPLGGLATAVLCLGVSLLWIGPAPAGAGAGAVESVPVVTTAAGGLAHGPAMSFAHDLTHVAVRGSTLYATDPSFGVIRAIDLTTGSERVVAGTGSTAGFYGDGGQATAAGLKNPMGIAVDPPGNLYIADTWNRRIRKVTPAGVISTVAGGGPTGVRGDGGPATGADISPTRVMPDGRGNLYVVDGLLVRMVDAAGRISTVVGDSGRALQDGDVAARGSLTAPSALALDAGGNLYVADSATGRIWKIGPDGIATSLRWAPSGTTGADAPMDVRVRADGTLLVLARLHVVAIDAAGNATTVVGDGTWGMGGDGGPATSAQVGNPTDMGLDTEGNLYLANGNIRRVDTTGIISSITSRDPSTAYWEGRPAVGVELASPESVAMGPQGTMYIGETSTGRLRRVDRSGAMTTIAGGDGRTEPAEGVMAKSAAVSPHAITVSPTGVVYFADGRGQVFKIDAAGVLRHVAGVGRVVCYGYQDCAAGDGGPATAAQLMVPSGLAVAADGTVYITDSHTNRVRRVDTSGIITTIAGLRIPGFSGDGGPATNSLLNQPEQPQLDAWGNLYFVDRSNNRVRKIDAAGIITTVAGAGGTVPAVDGGPALAGTIGPMGLALDPHGNLFISEGNRIRTVDTTGRISTVAGTGAPGFWGDGGPALDAALTFPRALAVDTSGDLIVADTGNNRIRRISVAADLRPPGSPHGWGWNSMGQTGGSASQPAAPVLSGGPGGFTQVAAGAFHSLGVRGDGTVWSWGWNVLGQLGDGTLVSRSAPAPVGSATLKGVTQVAGGAYHSLALKSDGSVWTWGWNGVGQLGHGTTVDRQTPMAVPGLTGVVAIAAGAYHSFAVKADGTVWAWGWNIVGQLGDGTTTDRHSPVQVSTLTGVVSVAAGALHGLAVKGDGTAWAWGWNALGTLGDGTTSERRVPVRVSGISGVTAVSGGAYHSLALKSDGSVWSWGWNGYGQLGDPAISERHEPGRVPGLAGVREVRAGWYHNVVRDATGTVSAWGLNHVGQLGDSTTIERHSPVVIPGLLATTLSVGAFHTLSA